MQKVDDTVGAGAGAGGHEDSAFVADVLLLFRLVLADDKVGSRARKALDRIAGRLTQFQGGGVEVARLVEAFGPLLPLDRAFSTFRDMEPERRIALARQVVAIANADAELAPRHERIKGRVAEILALEADDFG